MAERVVRTSKRLAAERQIHAAIAHFHAGEFECAIALCSAAEGQTPEPSDPINLFRILKRAGKECPAPDGEGDDFNFAGNWMKHGIGSEDVEIDEWLVLSWLNRAISTGTSESV